MVPGSRQVTANFLSHRTRHPYFHFSRDNWLYWAAEKRPVENNQIERYLWQVAVSLYSTQERVLISSRCFALPIACCLFGVQISLLSVVCESSSRGAGYLACSVVLLQTSRSLRLFRPGCDRCTTCYIRLLKSVVSAVYRNSASS